MAAIPAAWLGWGDACAGYGLCWVHRVASERVTARGRACGAWRRLLQRELRACAEAREYLAVARVDRLRVRTDRSRARRAALDRGGVRCRISPGGRTGRPLVLGRALRRLRQEQHRGDAARARGSAHGVGTAGRVRV